ncbi:Glyoxysomal fatty acid beta-oxidation multifunctional protein MFP-a [Capsicum chinense]|nr:Glyoxysomal fatty acid beta-oxidation multifunctional protein MFP-a [Capsicum chinense]
MEESITVNLSSQRLKVSRFELILQVGIFCVAIGALVSVASKKKYHKPVKLSVIASLYRTDKLESLNEAREILKLARDQTHRIAPNIYHPLAFIVVVEEGIMSCPHARLIKENETFKVLIRSSTCKALVHIFLSQCRTMKGVTDFVLVPRHVKKVAILGGGLMGSEIATVFLLSNYYAILKEVNDKVLEARIDIIKENLQRRANEGKLSQYKFVKALSLLKGTLDYETFKDVDIVIEDGTWGTIKGSCTVVPDFAHMCYHSNPIYLKALCDSPASLGLQPVSLIHVPGCIIVGLLGLIVKIPLYTAIAIIKNLFMLFKGWYRLIHDLISPEGIFFETICIPIVGLTILLWPIVVIGSVIMVVFSSFFIGLYGVVIVYQASLSKQQGIQYIRVLCEMKWFSIRQIKFNLFEAPPMLVLSRTSSRSVKEVIQEVKMVQGLKDQLKYLRLLSMIKITKRVNCEDSNVTANIMQTRSPLKERKGNESVELRPSTISSKIIMLEEQSVESYGNCYR